MNNDEHESVEILFQSNVKFIVVYVGYGILANRLNANITLFEDQLSQIKATTVCIKPKLPYSLKS
jgi:hypothetical protein